MVSDDFVKVPYKREQDGTKTFFLPDCRSPGGKGFRVGPKWQVQTIPDYWEALRRVMSFSPPEFRRASKNGNFGRIVCQTGDVEDVSRRHIEQMIAKRR